MASWRLRRDGSTANVLTIFGDINADGSLSTSLYL